ncbi:UBP9-binding protein [Colletotrichum musicola]|uniref:UBP9-binding protein n=1 Tax=Colletotrichum musicola TaxID=2175873 RepID=A0A8H6N4R8_9PEZI|nr:UBP9-binding protein [Colletotrichum musicola]
MAAKKARQRISYVLEPPANSQGGGHRLGVNGLAVDKDNALLYSGGRDGCICAWNTNLDLKGRSPPPDKKPKTTFHSQTQAHMSWINDIVLAANNSAVVTASQDLTVKLWRPHSETTHIPEKIGEHADYVKCVATPPGGSANWVASGGFDRKIYLWDLNGGGKTLEIDTKGEEVTEKGSIYALSVGHNIMANGGPESVVRLWDPRTGKRVTKCVGHTSNVRGILLNEAGDKVLTASSDHTVKLWSVTAGGRCMYTFNMHEDSVWSLFSDDPELGTFYSSDRSGFVVKTDVRGNPDEGLSVAVAHESHSISKVVAAGDYIWTATNTSSINRWSNVDMGPDLQLPEAFRRQRAASTASRPRQPSNPPPADAPKKKEISPRSILRISNTATFPVLTTPASDAPPAAGANAPQGIEPINQNPEETIEGQFGLVKHKLLNDRRRVLTLDTAGDVLLWDLIKCEPIKSFGKRHLEDVEPEVNTVEAVAPWCSIDISNGSLKVALEPFSCFDAEMYADDLILEEPIEFREDQRINLGKWMLRYLFDGLIDEEIKRDEAYRKTLNEVVERRVAASRANPPSGISIPTATPDWDETSGTPRANGSQHPPTPGMPIGLATPGPASKLHDVPEGTATPASPLDNRSSQFSRPSTEREDYFTSAIGPIEGASKSTAAPATPATEQPPATADSKSADTGKDKEKDKEKDKDASNSKSPSTPFGMKKFRMGKGMGMGMSFGSKKIGRSASTTAPEKPAVVDEKAEESEASSTHEKEVDDSFLGAIQKIRNDYDKSLTEFPDKLIETKITPSQANDTPVLKLPPGTKVVLQEEVTGGMANIYQGTVETVGQGADVFEQRGPMWLGEVLLLNQIPFKEPVKVSFVLQPWQNSLPDIASTDGNNRLNANRMLRVKKILAYVAERIETPTESPEPDALMPHEYLELICNDQVLPITMTLATLRTHIWKGSSDVQLFYKANGRKEIPNPPPQPAVSEPEPAPSQGTSTPPAAA